MATATPFLLHVPQDKLDLVQKKLELATFPDEIEDAGVAYGAPLKDIRRLVERWRNGFDWRKQEAAINADLPQFTCDIEVEGFGKLNIHFVHKQSAAKNAIPLLVVHGCEYLSLCML